MKTGQFLEQNITKFNLSTLVKGFLIDFLKPKELFNFFFKIKETKL